MTLSGLLESLREITDVRHPVRWRKPPRRRKSAGDRQYQPVAAAIEKLEDRQLLTADPIANDNSVTIQVGQTVTIDVLANDSDPDNDVISINAVGTPTLGTANWTAGDATVSYTAGSTVGTDTFSYTIADTTGLTATANIVVTVEAAPTNAPPVANSDTAALDANNGNLLVINVLGNDTDPEGSSLSLISVSTPANGTATLNGNQVEYLYADDGSTTDSFTYIVADSSGAQSTGTVTINITLAVDPIANTDTVSTTMGNAVAIDVLGNDTDPNNGTLTLDTVNSAANGSVTIDLNTNEIIYTPYAGFEGTDSFTYTISSSTLGSATGTVNVTVINQAPVAATITPPTVEEGNIIEIDALAGATDPEGHAITLFSVLAPTTGTLTIVTTQEPDYSDITGWWEPDPVTGVDVWMGATITSQKLQYVAAVGTTGSVTLSYVLQDALGAQTTGTVDVTVTPNPPPVAVGDAVTIDEGTTIQIDVLTNDSDPQTETFSISSVVQPTQGTVTIETINVPDLSDPMGWWDDDGMGNVTWMGAYLTNQVLQYVAPTSYAGVQTFAYTITDVRGATSTATVTVTINGQGQRVLRCCGGKDFEQEGFVPAADSALHHQTFLRRVLL